MSGTSMPFEGSGTSMSGPQCLGPQCPGPHCHSTDSITIGRARCLIHNTVNIRNPEPSGFGMVFLSDCRMVRYSNPIRKPDWTFLTTSLDCFIMNKIFGMTLFFIKRSRLVDHLKTGPICLVFEW
jgi:hypothetical protein